MDEKERYEFFKEGGKQIGLDLIPSQIHDLNAYLSELIRWNQKMNLTGLKKTRDIIIKNFLDALTPIPYLINGHGSRWMDVGTGAGFPGLAIKIIQPELEMTLIEPNQKKTAFLHHIIGLLKLRKVSVITDRLEKIHPPEKHEKADLLLTRALAPKTVFSAAKHHVCKGGTLLFFQSRYEKKDWESLIKKYSFVKFERSISLNLPFCNDPRTLILFEIQ